jgi:hypothetical protein
MNHEQALCRAIKIADEAREEWDKAPSGMRAGKILIALSGHLPGYRADIDEIHATLTSAPGPKLFDLEPCPFCGSEAHQPAILWPILNLRVWCSNDDCKEIFRGEGITEAAAAENWNAMAKIQRAAREVGGRLSFQKGES